MNTNLAFLGLGAMGAPMAANLAATGFTVKVWNRTPNDASVPAGATVSPSPRAAADGADFIVSMLANDAAVEAVSLGPDGLLESAAPGAIHIGMSTISLELTRRLVAEHGRRGVAYVAAPVFGRPEAAKAKQLWIVTGGEAAAIGRCQALLQAMGQGVFILGTAVDAALAKLVGNFLIAATIEALGEAYALAEKGGLDPERLHEMLGGTLLGSPVFKNYGARIARTEFLPAGFRLVLGLKDVRLGLAAASELGAKLPLADIIAGHLETAIARGREAHDFAGLATVIREEAGLGALRDTGGVV
jgi:3-hydroxyisobutyrate dehydrogenase-like beta-hydroxyacid dehydrogenase